MERHGSAGFPSLSTSLKRWVTRYNDPNGYYAVLNVLPTATTAEIRYAYLSMAKIHHPDNGGDSESFRYLNQIYATLINPATRFEYDNVKPGSMYAGQVESDDIRASAPPGEWASIFEEEGESPCYTYYADEQNDRLAAEWYGLIGPALRSLGVTTGTVRLGLERDIISPYVWFPSGYLPTLVVPQHISPNFFTALHILTETGYGQKRD